MKNNQVTTTGSNLPVKPLTAPPIAGIAFNILKTLTDPLVKDISDEELHLHCKAAIRRALMDTGYRVSGETDQEQINEIQYWADVLTIDIRTYYPTLRPKEIEIAMTRGVRKEYGEYFGLSPVTFSDFMKGYVADTARQKALEAHHKPYADPVELSDDQKLEIAKDCIRAAFADYCKDSDMFDDYGNAVGKALKSLNRFNFTDQQREGYMTAAVESLRKKAMAGLSKTKDEYSQKQAILKRLEALQTADLSDDRLVRIEASKLAVKDFFKSLVSAGANIEEILK